MPYLKYYTMKQAIRISGYEKRKSMVDYLCRQKLITPSGGGHGKKRLFSFRDLLLLKIYRTLLNGGVSVAKLKKGLEKAEPFNDLKADEEGMSHERHVANYLYCADGKLFFYKNVRELIDLDAKGGQYAFSFMICLQKLHHEVSKAATDERIKRRKKR